MERSKFDVVSTVAIRDYLWSLGLSRLLLIAWRLHVGSLPLLLLKKLRVHPGDVAHIAVLL
jgi:hypothetical protein